MFSPHSPAEISVVKKEDNYFMIIAFSVFHQIYFKKFFLRIWEFIVKILCFNGSRKDYRWGDILEGHV